VLNNHELRIAAIKAHMRWLRTIPAEEEREKQRRIREREAGR